MIMKNQLQFKERPNHWLNNNYKDKNDDDLTEEEWKKLMDEINEKQNEV